MLVGVGSIYEEFWESGNSVNPNFIFFVKTNLGLLVWTESKARVST